MRVALTRSTILGALVIGLALSASGGCRTGGGLANWSPTWPTWTGWGKPSSSTSLAQTKPSTAVPRPSASANPQAVASVAAGTGAASPQYATTTGTYPTSTTGYGTQAAAAYQQAGAVARFNRRLAIRPGRMA